MTAEIHDTVDQQLRRRRQRYTTGRRQLVDLLLATDRPLTIPELREHGATQSQSSIYRNLGALEAAGVVRRLSSSDVVGRFELAEAVSAHHHHHLVCSNCGRLEDVTLANEVEAALGDAVAQAQRDSSFRVDAHHLELVGTCGNCG